MYLHANAKLGLAGRFALVRAIEEGDVAEGGRGRLQRLAGDGASVVASVGGRRARRLGARFLACSIARVGRTARRGSSRRSSRRRICACRRKTGWGPRLVAGATGFAHSTVWKVLKPGRDLAPAARGSRSRPTATSGPAPAICCTWTRAATRASCGQATRHRRPLTALRNWMRPETRVGYDYAHAIVDDHSRLAYVELHDDEKAATVTGFVERALAFFAEHGIVAKRLMTDNALQLRQEPLAARAARPPRHPPPDDRALPATHQRQGRALPPDDGARMGLRARLPLTSTTQPERCHTGSTTTTREGRTAHSEVDMRFGLGELEDGVM